MARGEIAKRQRQSRVRRPVRAERSGRQRARLGLVRPAVDVLDAKPQCDWLQRVPSRSPLTDLNER